MVAREDGDEDGFRLWQSLSRQTELTAQLCSIMKDVRNTRGNAEKKIEKLRQLLSGVHSELTHFDEVKLVTNAHIYCSSMLEKQGLCRLTSLSCLDLIILINPFQPIRSPLAPTLLLTGVVPQESSIFKSSLIPLRLTFKTANGGTSKMIFKKGDDLRQDQLVIIQVLFSFSGNHFWLLL